MRQVDDYEKQMWNSLINTDIDKLRREYQSALNVNDVALMDLIQRVAATRKVHLTQ